jgi:hypothetical protein
MSAMQPSRTASIRRRPSATDGPVGIVIVIIAVAAATGILLLSTLLEVFLDMVWTYHPSSDRDRFDMMGTSAPALLTIGASIVCLIYCTLLFASGIAIRGGRPWGFKVAIVLFVLTSFAGNGTAAVGISIAAYCVLRLLEVIPSGAVGFELTAVKPDQPST